MAKLVLAMENDGAIGGAGDADLVAAANTATEVEAGAAESAEVEHSVSDIDTGISDAGEAADGLAEVQGEVADAVASGDGLSEREARLAEMAVEGYCKMVGINARKERLFPSMENFGGRHSKLAATRIVLESVGETLKRIWEAIKAAVARVIEWIKSFFNGMLKNVDQLAKHIANLKTRVNDLSSAAKTKNSSFSTGASLFTIAGKADKGTIEKVVGDSVRFMGASAQINSVIKKLMHDRFYSDSKQFNQTGTTDSGKAKGNFEEHKKYNLDAYVAIEGLLSGMKDAGAGELKKNDKADEKFAVYGNLPEGKSVAVRHEKADEGKTGKMSIEVAKHSTGMASSIEAPDKSAMSKLLNDTDGPLKALKDFDRTAKDNQKTLDEMMAHAAKMSKLAGEINAAGTTDKAEQDSRREASSKDNKEFTDKINIMKSISVDAPAMAFKAIKGVADYVAAGLSNMNVEKN